MNLVGTPQVEPLRGAFIAKLMAVAAVWALFAITFASAQLTTDCDASESQPCLTVSQASLFAP